jgi:hypothetical protein
MAVSRMMFSAGHWQVGQGWIEATQIRSGLKHVPYLTVPYRTLPYLPGWTRKVFHTLSNMGLRMPSKPYHFTFVQPVTSWRGWLEICVPRVSGGPKGVILSGAWIFKILTYLLTPWSKVLLEKLTGLQLVKKFPSFYKTRRFITAFTSACHLYLS